MKYGNVKIGFCESEHFTLEEIYCTTKWYATDSSSLVAFFGTICSKCLVTLKLCKICMYNYDKPARWETKLSGNWIQYLLRLCSVSLWVSLSRLEAWLVILCPTLFIGAAYVCCSGSTACAWYEAKVQRVITRMPRTMCMLSIYNWTTVEKLYALKELFTQMLPTVIPVTFLYGQVGIETNL